MSRPSGCLCLWWVIHRHADSVGPVGALVFRSRARGTSGARAQAAPTTQAIDPPTRATAASRRRRGRSWRGACDRAAHCLDLPGEVYDRDPALERPTHEQSARVRLRCQMHHPLPPTLRPPLQITRSAHSTPTDRGVERVDSDLPPMHIEPNHDRPASTPSITAGAATVHLSNPSRSTRSAAADRAVLGDQRLGHRAVARVSSPARRLLVGQVAEMVGELELERSLDQPLGQLRRQSAGPTISSSVLAPAKGSSMTSSGNWRRRSSDTRSPQERASAASRLAARRRRQPVQRACLAGSGSSLWL